MNLRHTSWRRALLVDKNIETPDIPKPDNSERRAILKAAGAGMIAATFSNISFAGSNASDNGPVKTLRWGFVGTGGIARRMADAIQQADHAHLVAVSSRRMTSARAFATQHNVSMAFDSWAEMCESDDVDAIYVATPTSVREEICIAAAKAGKHVLGEKPFANLESVNRIAAACNTSGVGFMDGTHFVHHPRTHQIRAVSEEKIGWPWSIDSAFQFELSDKSNIRYNTTLEPYGAIGDAGWYNMRAAVEFCAPGVEIKTVETFLRRDTDTGAAIGGSGVIVFSDDSTTTFNCGFDSGAGIMDLRITGSNGVIKLDDFLGARPSNQPADYEYRQNWGDTEQLEVASTASGASLMFDNYAAMVRHPDLIAASIQSTAKTQHWLDAIWESALKNENS
jgi:predicted dehydrogenase